MHSALVRWRSGTLVTSTACCSAAAVCEVKNSPLYTSNSRQKSQRRAMSQQLQATYTTRCAHSSEDLLRMVAIVSCPIPEMSFGSRLLPSPLCCAVALMGTMMTNERKAARLSHLKAMRMKRRKTYSSSPTVRLTSSCCSAQQKGTHAKGARGQAGGGRATRYERCTSSVLTA